MKKWLLALCFVFAVSTSFETASAQGGWDTVKKPKFGLRYRVPRDYHTLPPSPLEEYIGLIYEEDLPKEKDDYKKFQPRIEIVFLDHTKGVATPATGDEPPNEGPPQPVFEEEDQPKAVNSVATYVEFELNGWDLGISKAGDPVDGYAFVEHELVGKQGLRGIIYAYSNPVRTVAFIGYAHGDDLEAQAKIWEGMLKKLEIEEPDLVKYEEERGKLLKNYAKKSKYLDPEFRVDTIMELPDGWESEDTENYILVYSTKDQPLIRLVARELEAMRAEYEKLFPSLKPVTAVSRVRICKDKAEYSSYGGPDGSCGYWNSQEEELVFFDYDNVDGKAGTGKANSRIVLYHEAFHQYIFYSAGSFAPHSWFNEGTGDYFSGSKIKGSKVVKIDVNPWRIETIQEMIERKRFAHWKDMVGWSQMEYYGYNSEGLSGGLNYAQGWSMIYFLRESRVVKKHEVWSKILDTYFDTLRDSFAAGLADLESKELLDNPWERYMLGEECLEKALEAAFKDVDFDEIEEEWKEFVMDLKVPR